MENYQIEEVMGQILLAKAELSRSLGVFDDLQREKSTKKALAFLEEAREAAQLMLEFNDV